MRRAAATSELRSLAQPIVGFLDAVWRRMHWWIAAMGMLYAFSGITVVRPDEVAVLLRWGRLVGDSPALQQHGPGLLFALPKPMDQVVRVKTKRVFELPILTLSEAKQWSGGGDTLDPLVTGYALSGDQNVVHVAMIARYRVSDPVDWAFRGPGAEDVLRVEVTAAMVRSLGEMGIDHVLADGRKELIAIATDRAQAGLDAARSGLMLVALELTGLSPPRALARAFDDVQSAYIEAQTRQETASAAAEETVQRAHSAADGAILAATAEAETATALASGEAQAFLALARESSENPQVVHERLWRDAVDAAIGACDDVRWIPPPDGDRYDALRITLAPRARIDQASTGAGRQGAR